MIARCFCIEAAFGWTWTTVTSAPLSLTYSLNAISWGSFWSTNSTRPGTRRRSARVAKSREARAPPAFGIQLAWLQTVGGNEDQRRAGRGWCDGWGADRDRLHCLIFAADVVGIRGQRQILPALVGGDLRLVGCSGDRERIRAEQHAQWRIVDLSDLQDRLRGLERVASRRA